MPVQDLPGRSHDLIEYHQEVFIHRTIDVKYKNDQREGQVAKCFSRVAPSRSSARTYIFRKSFKDRRYK